MSEPSDVQPTWRDRFEIHPVVFPVSVIVIVVFLLAGALFTDAVGEAFAAGQAFIVETLGWYYIAVVASFVVFAIGIAVSPFGRIRLGRDDDEPEYGMWSWFAMLFSAGMGIGLLFFGVAEPVSHFMSPPLGEGGDVAAAQDALHLTYLHWGLHAWSIYIVVGLALAYSTHRLGRPLSIRWTLEPLLGDRVDGALGDVVDILAVFGTLFGVATSLGLGVLQVNAGLAHLGIAPENLGVQLALIAVITFAATVSVVLGLDKGIKRLSSINLGLAAVLLVAVAVAGPTVFLLSSFVESIGVYAQRIVGTTFRTYAYADTDWQASWTVFYWGWWISWAPFVGTFVARVSRGRTVRQFVAGVLVAPTALAFTWMVVFGNTAIHSELFGVGGIAEAVEENLPVALFVTLEQLPLGGLLSVLAIIIVITFFVTSSDSGSLVIDMLTSGGSLEPPTVQRVFWATTEGVVAAVLLLTGGLTALQAASIATALPFSVVMVLIMVSTVLAFRREDRPPSRLFRSDRRALAGGGRHSSPPEASRAPAPAPRSEPATDGVAGRAADEDPIRNAAGDDLRVEGATPDDAAPVGSSPSTWPHWHRTAPPDRR
jgi:choline/glycine/proline betaine transport protein